MSFTLDNTWRVAARGFFNPNNPNATAADGGVIFVELHLRRDSSTRTQARVVYRGNRNISHPSGARTHSFSVNIHGSNRTGSRSTSGFNLGGSPTNRPAIGAAALTSGGSVVGWVIGTTNIDYASTVTHINIGAGHSRSQFQINNFGGNWSFQYLNFSGPGSVRVNENQPPPVHANAMRWTANVPVQVGTGVSNVWRWN